jgi:hypothetical protein
MFEATTCTESACAGEWSYRMLLDDPRSLELFRKAGEIEAPVVLHIDTLY